MKLLTYLLSITALVLLAVSPALAVEICGDETLDVNGGEYVVQNGIWGEGAGEQCLDVNGTGFQVTYSTHTNGSQVKAYPCVHKGCSFGHCTTDPNMPVQVSKIQTATFSMNVNTAGAGGNWNVSTDSFFTITGAGDWAGGAELMVQIGYQGGNFTDSSRPTVNIGGHTWEVNFQQWDWNYIAYVIREPVSSVSNLNLKAFIDDAVSRGYIDSAWYLDSIAGGFEIWADGQGLTMNSFSANVTGEVLEIIPPGPPPASEVPVTGVWYKLLAGHSGKALEIADSSLAEGANAQQWDYTGGANQQWMLENAEDSGYYKLVNRNSGLCLEVQDWSTADGGNIQQGECGSYQNNEQWSLEREGDYYQVINRNSGRLIDVFATSAANGANIHQWTYYSDEATSQRWSFQRADGGTPVPTNPPGVTLGDVNSDDTIDIVDALIIAQDYVGLDPPGFNAQAADVNCDNSIDIVDALIIAQYYVGLIDHFC